MDFPEVVLHEGDGAPGALAERVRGWDITEPLIVASTHGLELAGAIVTGLTIETPQPGADQRWAAQVGSKAHRAGVDGVVAIGGGRSLDLAKLIAARAGVPVITVPTQLSHDGICSPVAVVPDSSGRAQSVGAVTPLAVLLPLQLLAEAPSAAARAGLGDLVANPLALRDWKLASERGLEKIDPQAWELSIRSHELVTPYLENEEPSGPAFTRALADALIASGLSMICSGTSRPASGGEHEISHAIDILFGGPAMHGAQVAFGSIISTALYGDDVEGFRRMLRRLSLPDHPRDLGLSEDDLVRVILEAPDTRPGRFTILEHADLDEEGARALVHKIWDDAD